MMVMVNDAMHGDDAFLRVLGVISSTEQQEHKTHFIEVAVVLHVNEVFYLIFHYQRTVRTCASFFLILGSKPHIIRTTKAINTSHIIR